MGRAAVVDWRRRRLDFPTPVAGTDLHPWFPRPAVIAWLVAHDKIAVPAGVPSATLILRSDPTGERRFRLDDPRLELADDAADEDRLSGWTTDGDALAVLTANEGGVSVRRPTEAGAPPLAVPGRARVIDRFRSGSGALRITLAWPAGLCRTAARRASGGTVRHAVPTSLRGRLRHLERVCHLPPHRHRSCWSGRGCTRTHATVLEFVRRRRGGGRTGCSCGGLT
ncbi:MULTISPECIES: hypothetical protein [Streptomyces]|uniref:hypothetical protein n=1 Tax=Streptomyces TaxID=1883 RepID=UPI000789495E|nr:hypothetical protein [Streptomyces sp. WAC00288]AVH93777.1 hypothetical protein C5L38_00765 [Streptomyces sp. WAC00288]